MQCGLCKGLSACSQNEVCVFFACCVGFSAVDLKRRQKKKVSVHLREKVEVPTQNTDEHRVHS